MGGYADYWRGHSHFVFKIPDALPSDVAAPMLCGGVTTFSPLLRNGAGPGKRVGIVGIGGLGHFGVLGSKGVGVRQGRCDFQILLQEARCYENGRRRLHCNR